MLLELVIVPLLLRHRTHGRMLSLPQPMRTLAQTSKRDARPHDYVLLLGDSNAEGKGDWFLEVDRDSGAAFHSAHVIHERTGADVMSFGKGGVSSMRGFVSLPVQRTVSLARCFVEPPRVVLAYFFEGNDLDNNIDDLRTRWAGRVEEAALRDDRAFDRFLREEVAEEAWWDGVGDLFYMDAYIRDTLRALREGSDDVFNIPSRDAPGEQPGDVNLALVAGETVALPDEMQSPSLELTVEELDVALRVTERSLLFAAGFYEGADFHVVYVPSPLASYRLASPEVDIQTYHGRSARWPAARVGERSDLVAARLADFAAGHGLGFLDLRPAIRAASAEQVVHGPGDWKHFSRVGYTVMGTAIAEYLQARAGGGGPGRAGPGRRSDS